MEDGGELICTDVPSVKKRGRPSRKEVRAVEEAPLSPKASSSKIPNASEQILPPSKQPGVVPKRPHSPPKATDSSSLSAVLVSHSVNVDVQDSDTGTAEIDSNKNDNASVPLLYLQPNGQLEIVEIPEMPPINFINDISTVCDKILLLLLYFRVDI